MLGSLQRRLIYRRRREKPFAPHQAGLDPATVTPVQVPTHDNLVLHGWHVSSGTGEIVQPYDAGNAERARRLVIYFPGNSRNRKYRGINCLTLTEAGADVLLVDYRGYAENPGE